MRSRHLSTASTAIRLPENDFKVSFLVYSWAEAMFSRMSCIRLAGLSVGNDNILLHGTIKTVIEFFQRDDFDIGTQDFP